VSEVTVIDVTTVPAADETEDAAVDTAKVGAVNVNPLTEGVGREKPALWQTSTTISNEVSTSAGGHFVTTQATTLLKSVVSSHKHVIAADWFRAKMLQPELGAKRRVSHGSVQLGSPKVLPGIVCAKSGLMKQLDQSAMYIHCILGSW